ncbi:MAG: hypothetical protein R3B70_43580 [Polyangiaceae bacterium]
MIEAFRLGGWGMYPTALFGLILVAVSIRYAVKPEARFVPLQITLGLLTLFAGMLGFVTGLITTFSHMSGVPFEGSARWIPLIGAGESLVNIAAALTLIVLATIAASIGAAQLARSAPRPASA